jgi:hypothetical protein
VPAKGCLPSRCRKAPCTVSTPVSAVPDFVDWHRAHMHTRGREESSPPPAMPRLGLVTPHGSGKGEEGIAAGWLAVGLGFPLAAPEREGRGSGIFLVKLLEFM